MAYVRVVLHVLNSGASWLTEGGAALAEPEQRVAVQQEPHSMYSRKSSRGSSKSGASWIFPARQPKRGWRARRGAASSVAVTFTGACRSSGGRGRWRLPSG